MALTAPDAVEEWTRAVELAPREIRDEVAVFAGTAARLADRADPMLGEVGREVYSTRQRAADARLDAYVSDGCGFSLGQLEPVG